MIRLRSALTLVEVLVSIGIVALLVSLALPVILATRETARRAACKNNVKQIGLALHLHHDAKQHLPAGWVADQPLGIPGWGWAAEILPFLDEVAVQVTFKNKGQAIAAARNEELRATPIRLFLCPSDPTPEVFLLRPGPLRGPADKPGNGNGKGPPMFPVARANYAGIFGTQVIEDAPGDGNGTFFFNSNLRFRQITDGLSKTAIVGERSSRLGATTWVGVVPGAHRAMARVVGRGNHVPNDILADFDDFSSYHPFGAHFLMADGSVHLVSDEIDLAVYEAVASRAGGELEQEKFAMTRETPAFDWQAQPLWLARPGFGGVQRFRTVEASLTQPAPWRLTDARARLW